VKAVLSAELPVALLQVSLPHFLAVEIVAGQVAAAGKYPDVLAVGRRRRGCPVALIPANDPSFWGELLFPQFLPCAADTHQHDVAAVLAGQEDALAPDSGSGPTHARHLELPGDVLRVAPLGRDVGLLADAVMAGAAP